MLSNQLSFSSLWSYLNSHIVRCNSDLQLNHLPVIGS